MRNTIQALLGQSKRDVKNHKNWILEWSFFSVAFIFFIWVGYFYSAYMGILVPILFSCGIGLLWLKLISDELHSIEKGESLIDALSNINKSSSSNLSNHAENAAHSRGYSADKENMSVNPKKKLTVHEKERRLALKKLLSDEAIKDDTIIINNRNNELVISRAKVSTLKRGKKIQSVIQMSAEIERIPLTNLDTASINLSTDEKYGFMSFLAKLYKITYR